ncbi:MAG TPA: ABC transporter substrate-binding protein [Candidatus Acidoferrum sp.]|jgi:peptide/nickel transport system substrate-binding protein|nr:ABC transporter substrate-binding protein [Candidatus Acidoferrum sp.]
MSRSFRSAVAVLLGVAVVAGVLAVRPVESQTPPSPTPKSGGSLNVMLREDLSPGFAIHETSTIGTVFPASPCFNNLVYFDPLKSKESVDTIIGELAEKWSWQDNYRNLVFFLRRDVKWHDGKPFTSKDVKFTFDMVREAPDAVGKLRLNPRKDWYVNVDAIEAPDAYTVVFRLKRPQPSLIMMLASGYSPVYAAHVPPTQYRTSCVGTGPFKVKEWRHGEFLEYVKNPDYFIKGRPYLDGMKYIIIKERGTRTAALQAGQLDMAQPGETTKAAAEQLKAAVPKMTFQPFSTNVTDNIIMNFKKPPFDNPKVRLAVSYAIDRRGLIQAVHQGSANLGAGMAPRPYGVWGLAEKDLLGLPGYGKAADMKAQARKLLAEAKITPQNPLKVEMVTRAIAIYVDMASFVINELKQVGIEATLKQVETAQWHPMATRGDYQIGANLTGLGPDDPDANFYENFACGSPRNYAGYCNEQVMKMIEAQSQEIDPKKRLGMVWAIQKKLEEDAARPVLDWRMDYFAMWPHVKNLIPHQSIYNFGRMQEVWRE